MDILVAAATALEIPGIISKFAISQKKPEFQHRAEVLITGVGSVPTTFQLTKHLLSNKYDLVIGAGIAGSFNSTLQPGEVVFVQKDCFADLGVIEHQQFRSLFDLNLSNPNEHPFHNGWIENGQGLAPDFNLKSVAACTVNTISTGAQTIARLLDKYNPDIETMEGAALQYTCKILTVPFLQLRAVSNMVGERDKSKWTIQHAVTNLEMIITKILTHQQPFERSSDSSNRDYI